MSERLDYRSVSPEGMAAFAAVSTYLAKSGLRKALLDVVYLRVSQINGCAFCIDKHSRDLLQDGFSTDKLALVSVWHEAGDLFSPRERAALAWSETVTKVAQTAVPDRDYQAAKAEFSDKEMVDLTAAISLMNAYNRLAISFRSMPEGAKLSGSKK